MKKFALIKMPWGSINYPSISVGLLKSVLSGKGLETDSYYLNVRFAKYLDYNTYTRFENDNFFGNWVFSSYLFGKFGTGEFDNGYMQTLETLLSDPFYSAYGMTIRKDKVLFEDITGRIIVRYIEECLNDIPWEEYYAVGFSCQYFNEYIPSLVFSDRLKRKYSDLKVIFGGASVSGQMGIGTLKHFRWVDYVVDGEGEVSLPQLLKNIQIGDPYAKIPGMSFNRGTETLSHQGRPEFITLDDNPLPDYSDYYKEIRKAGFEKKLGKWLVFESSRGCWWGQKVQCTFCSINQHSIAYRTKSADQVYYEISRLLEQYPEADKLYATDSILNNDLYNTLLPRLKEIKSLSSIVYEVKSDLNRKQLELLYEAHINHIQPGIENLNTNILKLMRKGVSAIKNIQLLKIAGELSINIIWNFLHSFPGEKQEDYKDLINTVNAVSHLQPPGGFIPMRVERFSAYFRNPGKYNIRCLKPALYYSILFHKDRICLEDIAYHYDFTCDSYNDTGIRMLIGKLDKMVSAWQSYYKDRKIFCILFEDGDCIKIKDNRPANIEDPAIFLKERMHEYTGAKKVIYCFCSDIHSFMEIQEFIESSGFDLTERQLRDILDGFVSERLMYSENEKFLSLAQKIGRQGNKPVNMLHST